MSQIAPNPSTNTGIPKYQTIDSYPLATVTGRSVTYTQIVDTQVKNLLSNLPLKLPNRLGVNETYTTSTVVNNKVYIGSATLGEDSLVEWGPWVNGLNGSTGATGIAVGGYTGFNIINKTYKVISNGGTTGGNKVPNYNDGLIRPTGTTGTTGVYINIVPFNELTINENTIDFETNCIPLDSVYGRFPLAGSYQGTGLTGSYTYPTAGFTGIEYVPPNGYTGPLNQRSNIYDNNNNYPLVQNIRFSIPRNPTISSTPTASTFGIEGFSLKNTPIYNSLSRAAYDAVSVEAIDANYQHCEETGTLHTHSAFAFINNNQDGSWKISTDVRVIGFITDGFPVVAPYLVYDPTIPGYRVIQNSDLDECHGIRQQISFTLNGTTLTYPYYYVGTLEFPYIFTAYRGTPTSEITNSSDIPGALAPPSLLTTYPIYDQKYINFMINPDRLIKISPNTSVPAPGFSNYSIHSINRKTAGFFQDISVDPITGVLTLNRLRGAGSWTIIVEAYNPSVSPTNRQFTFRISVNM